MYVCMYIFRQEHSYLHAGPYVGEPLAYGKGRRPVPCYLQVHNLKLVRALTKLKLWRQMLASLLLPTGIPLGAFTRGLD